MASPGATALDQARSAGRFTPVHDAWWAAVVKAHGERDGTRALIEVLLLSRHLRSIDEALDILQWGHWVF